jgi:isoleucyl-tRNA synthetase
VTKKTLPGYVLVEMRMSDQSWNVVRNTPGVTGFVGGGGKPTPLRDEEVADILKRMDTVRRACSLGHAVRHQNRLRVRQPLREVILAGGDSRLAEKYADIIEDELNVRKVSFTDDVGEMGRQEIAVDSRLLGPRFGKKMKEVLDAVKSGNVRVLGDGSLLAAGETINRGEYELRIFAREGRACMSDGGLFVCLDLFLDREMELEGLARDVIRVVQNARREAGLIPDERIRLGLGVTNDLKEAVGKHRDLIQSEVLAVEMAFGEITDAVYTETVDIQGETMDIRIGRK